MKSKAVQIILFLIGSVVFFVVFVGIILMLQGRLDLKKYGITTPDTSDKSNNKSKAEKTTAIGNNTLPLPAPFTFREVANLVKNLKDKKQEYETKLKALEVQREELKKIREDIVDRKKEVQIIMKKVTALISELDSKRALVKKEQQQLNSKQKQNFKKLAKMFESMDGEEAARKLEKMDNKTVASLLFMMRSRKASKILSNFKPDKVKVLTQLLHGGGG